MSTIHTGQAEQKIDFKAALQHPSIRLFLGSVGTFTLASRAMVVILGFQVYDLTHSTLAIGLLGLIEAVPMISMVLVGGYVADHYNRRNILILTRGISIICALLLAYLSLNATHALLPGIYAVVLVAGIARAFADPASSAYESMVVPKNLTVNASSWIGSTWISCSVIGPAAIGFIFSAHGAFISYLTIALLFSLSLIFNARIPPLIQPKPTLQEPMFKSIRMGWRFVLHNPALLWAMALDLFAVLLGGAVALLPVYAHDILHVGSGGLGLLNAATAFGSLIIMLFATRYAHLIMRAAGRNLILTVAGFGLSILLFAFSTNFILSMIALTLSGIFDGINMVIRRSMVRLLSPNEMRGRISSVSWIFVSASNELGAFESGLLASLVGTVPCVAIGGLATLLIAGATAWFSPALRNLRFNTHTWENNTTSPSKSL